MRARATFALVALLAASLAARPGDAQTTPPPQPAPADCSIVGPGDAARILGYPVQEADDVARSAGICFYSTRAISDEGALSYAVVTAPWLPERRAFFAAQARRCSGISSGAPKEFICKSYIALAVAADLAAYFAARTSTPDATPVPALGNGARATEAAVYVMTKTRVIEAVVRRGDALDLDRSSELAKLLLSRLAP